MDLSLIVHDFKPNKRQKVESNPSSEAEIFLDSMTHHLKLNQTKNICELEIVSNGEKISLINNIKVFYNNVKKLYKALNPNKPNPKVSVNILFLNYKHYVEWSNFKIEFPELMNNIIKSELKNFVKTYKMKTHIFNTKIHMNEYKKLIVLMDEFREYVQEYYNAYRLPYIKLWKYNVRNKDKKSTTLWIEFYIREDYITEENVFDMLHIFYNKICGAKDYYY